MEYTDWNSKLAHHFFRDFRSEKVFLCVTKDTLSQISDLDADEAVSDFVAAIQSGPVWTQISGCNEVTSKAHNCLHPDPCWRSRPVRDTEKRQLNGHKHWRAFRDWPQESPPYLAYLAFFVLAWTERSSGFTGNDYYGPLNDLLGPNSNLGTRNFNASYEKGDRKISINDIWQDLRSWAKDNARGECQLPPDEIYKTEYVLIPKYFGLFKAADLRNLNRLFYQLEEDSTIDPANPPRPSSFVGATLSSQSTEKLLSRACVRDLRKALQDQQQDLLSAYGALLDSKYRLFDGSAEEDEHKRLDSGRRLKARLLRICQGSVFKSVVKLRSEKILDSLPLDSGETLGFVSSEKHAVRAAWQNNSVWFHPLDAVPARPLDRFEVSCEEISLKASMSSRQFLVMTTQGLPRHLQTWLVETDQVHAGRQYVLLAPGKEAPRFAGLNMTVRNIQCPSGFSAWTLNIPVNVDRENWPDLLPPLAIDEKGPTPRLKFVTGFRAAPREDKFIAGLPLVYSTDSLASAPFLKSTCERVKSENYEEEDAFTITLLPEAAGRVTLALKDVQTDAEVPNSERLLEFIELANVSPVKTEASLFDGNVSYNCAPIPMAAIQLKDGTLWPFANGPTGPLNVLHYFLDDPPSVRIKSSTASDELHVLANGSKLPRDRAGHWLNIDFKRGDVLLETRLGALTLDQAWIRLFPTPRMIIRGISTDKNHPTEVNDIISASIQMENQGDNERLAIEYRVRETEVAAQILLPRSGELIDCSKCELTPGKTYRIDFSIGNVTLQSAWFKLKSAQSERHESDSDSKKTHRVQRESTSFAKAFSLAESSQQKRRG